MHPAMLGQFAAERTTAKADDRGGHVRRAALAVTAIQADDAIRPAACARVPERPYSRTRSRHTRR